MPSSRSSRRSEMDHAPRSDFSSRRPRGSPMRSCSRVSIRHFMQARSCWSSRRGALAAPLIRRSRVLSGLVFLIAIGSCAWAPRAAKRLARADNLRIVLVDHAPILGRAVKIAAKIVPPQPIDDISTSDVPVATSTHALDWSGDDIVLISVDALRADHLGVYGAQRATSPHIDALAKEGVVFDAAYCPTPHTSYSVTSLMTGKYMRPLLALAWATTRRRGPRSSVNMATKPLHSIRLRFSSSTRTSSRASKIRRSISNTQKSNLPIRHCARRRSTRICRKRPPTFRSFCGCISSSRTSRMSCIRSIRSGGDHPTDADAYDSEIAAADQGIGNIVAAVRAQRPRAVFIITADHGEEFGDHGGAITERRSTKSRCASR